MAWIPIWEITTQVFSAFACWFAFFACWVPRGQVITSIAQASTALGGTFSGVELSELHLDYQKGTWREVGIYNIFFVIYRKSISSCKNQIDKRFKILHLSGNPTYSFNLSMFFHRPWWKITYRANDQIWNGCVQFQQTRRFGNVGINSLEEPTKSVHEKTCLSFWLPASTWWNISELLMPLVFLGFVPLFEAVLPYFKQTKAGLLFFDSGFRLASWCEY